MPFNLKIGLRSNTSNLVCRQTKIELNYTMARRTGEMMVMMIATHSIAMSTISKIDTIQETFRHQFIDRTKDCCSTNT
ncbi:hypothetical protein KDH_29060 [Dictyobacter sp. S3.2.2.5]|uniref:Uncharacterized protein n=1 Tax=Dictyobacter halimunensis TaxID=3026934 RepID=A0ABQ6FUF3_9CHLR|nr:hypothetical protein KDH_29060 [Dictyobacter sp. S3.2.2.5]